MSDLSEEWLQGSSSRENGQGLDEKLRFRNEFEAC